MIPGSLAKRYSRALFEIATTAAQRDRFLQSLAEFVTACKTRDPSGHNLMAVLASGQHTLTNRRAVLGAVLQRTNADPTVVRFLQLVLQRGRIAGIEQIYLHFRDLADESANRIRATVKTAARLEPGADKRIQAALESATGKTVLLSVEEDPELIGGLVAHVGSFTLDRSVRTSLERLRITLRH
ncbi:ATP synthase F1 subunit delta [Nannocystaceae bacterium ST9]